MKKLVSSVISAVIALNSAMAVCASAENNLLSVPEINIEAAMHKNVYDPATIDDDYVPESLLNAAHLALSKEEYDYLTENPGSYTLKYIDSEIVAVRNKIVIVLDVAETVNDVVGVDPGVSDTLSSGQEVMKRLDAVFFAVNAEKSLLDEALSAIDGVLNETTAPTTSTVTTTNITTTSNNTTTTSVTTTVQPTSSSTAATTNTTQPTSSTTTTATTIAKPTSSTTTAATTTAQPTSSTTTTATTTVQPTSSTTTAVTTKSTSVTTPDVTTTVQPTYSTTTAQNTSVTTTTITTTSNSETSTLTNEELMKNADVNGDGKIDAVDASIVIDYVLNNDKPAAGKGDVNGNGKIEINDFKNILSYYAKISVSNHDKLDDYFISLSTLPENNEKTVKISQKAVECNEGAKFSEFALEFNADSQVYGLSGEILFNGKTYKEAGFEEIELEFERYKYSWNSNSSNSKIVVYGGKSAEDKIIVRVYGGNPGKYDISYNNLTFYDEDGVKYSNIKKENFVPVLSINPDSLETTTSITTTPIITSTTSSSSFTNEELMSNADVNDDGNIDAADASIIFASSLLDTSLFSGSKGDVNGDGIVNFKDGMYTLEYYKYFSINSKLVEDYFISLMKLPNNIDNTITISQTVAVTDPAAEYNEFVLSFRPEQSVYAVTGRLLLNGKPYSDLKFKEFGIDGHYMNTWIEPSTGNFYASISPNRTETDDSIVFKFNGGEPGEYTISYDDLKFYGPNYAEYSGYTKNDFNPYLTIIEKSPEVAKLGDYNGDGMIDAVDASKILSAYAKYATGTSSPTADDLTVCDVNKDGFIDAVDASKVLAYYAYVSTGGAQSLEDFLTKKD